jgi:hypothetical protein
MYKLYNINEFKLLYLKYKLYYYLKMSFYIYQLVELLILSNTSINLSAINYQP